MPTDNPLVEFLRRLTADAERMDVISLVAVAVLGDGGARAVEMASLDDIDAMIAALQVLREKHAETSA